MLLLLLLLLSTSLLATLDKLALLDSCTTELLLDATAPSTELDVDVDACDTNDDSGDDDSLLATLVEAIDGEILSVLVSTAVVSVALVGTC